MGPQRDGTAGFGPLGLDRPRETLRQGLLLGTAGAAALASVAFFAAAPALPGLAEAVPAIFTFAVVAAVGSAWLLRVHDEMDPDPALRWAAAGYAVSGMAMLLAVISFPTISPTGGPLRSGPSQAAALYLTWHGVVAIMTLLGTFRTAPRRALRRGAVVVALALVVLAAADLSLPSLVHPDGDYTAAFRGFLTLTAALSAVATWRWVIVAGRAPTWPRAWVAVSLLLLTWDLVLYGFAERRLSVAWWASLSSRIAGFVVLALGLLVGVRTVFRSLNGYAERLTRLAAERDAAARDLATANQELQAFAHVVAHDLRSPLTGASGYVDLARAAPEELSVDVVDLLERASVQHRRMSRLITDLLEYAEVSHGDVQRAPVDLAALGHEVVRERSAESTVTVDGLPNVTGDPMRLRQLLDNLIGNALKYVPPGVDPHVRVWAETTDGQVTVHVDDNGIGIDPARAEEIFQPFVRTNDARAGYPGTGIGLAICQRVVEQHDGSIRAVPRPSGGTRFTFTLPAGEGPALRTPPVRAPQDAG
ncbi:ATP-binding protein [Egicoccus sp. AB-alg2]|uniref:sensor histidine kinase n=1 Tax=Egicoccus sp. AB-alg2 TaxID=3242693 RepID=UPI00359E0B70